MSSMSMRRASMNQGVQSHVVHTVDETLSHTRHDFIDTSENNADPGMHTVPSEVDEEGEGNSEAAAQPIVHSVVEKVGLQSYLYRENDQFDVKRDNESNRFIRNLVLLAKGKISFYNPLPDGGMANKPSRKIYPKG